MEPPVLVANATAAAPLAVDAPTAPPLLVPSDEPPRPAPVAASPMRLRRKVGYGLATGGGAALIGAMALGIASNNSWNQFLSCYDQGGNLPAQKITLAGSALNRASFEQNGAYLAAAAGTTAVAAGVYFLFFRKD